MKKSFYLFLDSLSIIDKLSDEQNWKLLKMMRSYHNGEKYEPNDFVVEIAFEQFKNQFDRDLETYNNVCERNASNWAKWWRPKKNPENPSGFSETQRNPEKPKKADKDKDTDTDKEKDKDKEKKELKESNLYIKGVEDFILFQKNNIPWINYQIEKQWEGAYLQKQYEAYNKILSINKIDSNSLNRILEFIKQDRFRNKQIWSITKLLEKNKEWVPYWVVMIDKIKSKIDDAPKVFRIDI